MPSFEEPFGLVFCEAMAMERPVVALESGGTLEVVEHGRTGMLSPPGDFEALAANLMALLVIPSGGRRWVRPGVRSSVSASSVERMAADVASRLRSGSLLPSIIDQASRSHRGSPCMRDLATADVDEFRRAFDEDGFVVMRDVVSRDRLTELAESLTGEYERLCAENGTVPRRRIAQWSPELLPW